MASRFSVKYMNLLSQLEEDRQLLIGVLVVGFFMFVFFACMLAFIDNAKSCFLGSSGTMSKTDEDFMIAGNLIASLGLVAGIISLILCGLVMRRMYNA